MELEAAGSAVVEPHHHPIIELLGEETILKPLGNDDLILSFEAEDFNRWVGELRPRTPLG